MCVLSIDTTFMTIGAAVVELYSFVFEFDENDTKKKNKNKKNKKNNQLPLLELLVAAKNTIYVTTLRNFKLYTSAQHKMSL